jgi:hypothetical protein
MLPYYDAAVVSAPVNMHALLHKLLRLLILGLQRNQKESS